MDLHNNLILALFIKAAKLQRKSIDENRWGHAMGCGHQKGNDCDCGLDAVQEALKEYEQIAPDEIIDRLTK